MPDISSFSFANIFGAFLFGMIGLGAFMYGRKQHETKPLVVGIVLMAYPYFISNTLLIYGIGAALCALLYFWRD